MSPSSRPPRNLGPDLLWELPLGLLSWGFFHLNKALIARLYQKHLDRKALGSRRWQILSAETLQLPVSLPVLLTKGPRWNTHASIGTLGPLPVQHQLAIHIGEAHRSAEAWSVVVYRYPSFETFRELGSLTTPAEEGWSVLALPAGQYVLGVRYYGLQSEPRLPAVQLDRAAGEGRPGSDAVASEPLPPDGNRVYDTLAQRTSPYHHALHHYVHTMLRLRRWLPPAFVRREFLPVGDPFTEFRYGWFAPGSQLQVRCAARLLEEYRVLLSVYNRASLPVHSHAITDPVTLTPRFEHAGFYLFRLRPRQLGLASCAEEELIVLPQSGGSSPPLPAAQTEESAPLA
jgi:hypothetical protein